MRQPLAFAAPLLVLCCLASPAARAADEPFAIMPFFEGFTFTYESWKDRIKGENGRALLGGFGVNANGGGGCNVTLDLSKHPDWSPAIELRTDPSNRMKILRLMITDAKGRAATYHFLVGQVGQDWTTIMPEDGAPLNAPNVLDAKKGLTDLAAVSQWHLQGDWSSTVLALEIKRVLVVPPSEEVLAQRVEGVRKATEAKAKARKELDAALAGIQHTTNGPVIEAVGTVAPDIIGIQIQQGVQQLKGQEPYAAQAGDEIRPQDAKAKCLVWKDGKLVEDYEGRMLYRNGQLVGSVNGGRDGRFFLLPAETMTGDDLNSLTAGEPASYTITSNDDADFAKGLIPVEVHRKSKSTNRLEPFELQPVRHIIYLQMGKPFKDGKTYTIAFPGVNVSVPAYTYKHDSRTVRSEAVHGQQVGYRADDPFKRGFLSLWLGTGGAYTYPRSLDRFQLLDDASGAVVFTGDISSVMPADGVEQLRVKKNYAKTAVYALDFSSFNKPGTYRISVPGVGCSHPFPLGDTAWSEAFRISMMGNLHLRSGIELGPPFTTYKRPRPYHPDDGMVFYESTLTYPEGKGGEGTGNWFAQLQKARTDKTFIAWGGYMDAGNYDRRKEHFLVSWLHLELFEMFPEYFAKLKLNLPASETGNTIPDILDEVLWNTDFWLRMQRKDGGIRGGLDVSAHPRMGEVSWHEACVAIAYAPDAEATYLFAGVFAKMARSLKPYDAAKAEALKTAALKAWTWAGANAEDSAKRRKSGMFWITTARNLAAVELLWLTGDATYDAAYKETSTLIKDKTFTDQQLAAFTYARLPTNLGDAAVKAQCVAQFRTIADKAVEFGRGNVFGITTEFADLPEIGFVSYWGTPGILSQVVLRAHYLTGDEKYLVGGIRACNYQMGANPNNITYTVGLGTDWPRHPLHLDSRWSGQPAPAGISVYGQSDPERNDGFNDWVHTWFVGKTGIPDSRTWPAHEAYVDLGRWPAMNEFTIYQNVAPTNYWLGYLAARKAK